MATAAVVADAPVVYVVQVMVTDESSLRALLDQGFVVSNVEEREVTLYVADADYRRLMSLGYAPRVLEVQPDPRNEEKAATYTSNEQIGVLFQDYARDYSQLCEVFSIGRSVNGRDLWVIKITEDVSVPADKPAVKYISTIHGDEPVGTELSLYFIEELLEGYGDDPYITGLLARTVFWVLPMMNPDGFANRTRANANYFDLNRSFPTYGEDFTGNFFDDGPMDTAGRQPEVAHVMRWSEDVHCALSANFHTGALVANYPYDYEPGIPSRANAPSPDDDMFRFISLEYSSNNLPMYNSAVFHQGITNGSLWYSITGGMMDWNYRYMGCPEVTMEVSAVKWPNAATLPQYWADNRDAMFAYAETAHMGIRGIVFDRASGTPIWSKVLVDGNTQPVFSTPEVGNYHRLLMPGRYDLSFVADGYIRYRVNHVEVTSETASRVDVPLSDGDVNGDGRIDSEDVHLVVDAVLGRAVAHDADVDGLGLSATDIQAVINQTLLL